VKGITSYLLVLVMRSDHLPLHIHHIELTYCARQLPGCTNLLKPDQKKLREYSFESAIAKLTWYSVLLSYSASYELVTSSINSGAVLRPTSVWFMVSAQSVLRGPGVDAECGVPEDCPQFM
jgi:hypothetical protein